LPARRVREVLFECGASSHRFWPTLPPTQSDTTTLRLSSGQAALQSFAKSSNESFAFLVAFIRVIRGLTFGCPESFRGSWQSAVKKVPK